MGRILLRIISIGLTIAFHSFLQILFVESLSLVGWIHFIDCGVNAYQSGFSFYGVLVLMYYSFNDLWHVWEGDKRIRGSKTIFQEGPKDNCFPMGRVRGIFAINFHFPGGGGGGRDLLEAYPYAFSLSKWEYFMNITPGLYFWYLKLLFY